MKRLLIIGPWTERAACKDMDPDIFFLAEDERYKPGRFDEAMRTCRGCPVRFDCGNYATAGKERWGIWAMQDRGEKKHADREQAVQGAGVPLPGDEAEEVLRLPLAGRAAGGRPDECSA